jgi:peptidoglycan/LPS O-acetylase OafA/YrhL
MPAVAKFSSPPDTAMPSPALLEALTPAEVLPEARSSRAWTILSRWFTRITCSQAYIPEVDGLRFLAILPVLIFHVAGHLMIERGWHPSSLSGDSNFAQGWLLEIISAGGSGVQLFFVLSGFIVALPFARHHLENKPAPSTGNYLLRRATRIEPPYLLALTVIFLISRHHRANLTHYLAGLVYGHQLIFGARNPLNPGTWSLEAEIVFYLLAPWLARIYRIRGSLERRCLLLALIAVSSWTLYHQLLSFASPHLSGTFAFGLPYFLTGMLLADLYVSGLIAKAQSVAWDIAAVVSAVLIVLPAMNLGGDIYWINPFFLMTIFIAAFNGSILRRFLRLPLVTIIGGMCYSLYLWHPVLLIGTGHRLFRLLPRGMGFTTATTVFCVLVVPLLIVAIAPLYLLTEKPFMNGPGSRYLDTHLRRIGAAIRRRLKNGDHPSVTPEVAL